jgi:hypothetical protein
MTRSTTRFFATAVLAAAAAGMTAACLEDLQFVRSAGAYCDDVTPCIAGNYCDLQHFVCAPKLAGGERCNSAAACSVDPQGPICQCQSGSCASGVCCDTACNDDCTECNRPGSEGTCVAALPGTDPGDDCPGSTSCSEAGACQGSAEWSIALGESGSHEIADVAVGPSGEIVAVGASRGQLVAGALSVQIDGEPDALVVRLDDAGTVTCAAVFGDLAEQRATAVAIGAGGRIFVAGWFRSQMTVGADVLAAPTGAPDMFVLALDDACEPLWGKHFGESFGAPSAQLAHDLAVDASGDIVLVGEVESSVRFNAVTMPARGIDAFVARLSADGTELDGRLYGDVDALATAPQRFTAVSTQGGLAVAGDGSGAFFLDHALAPASDRDVFLAWLDAGLSATSSRHYQGAGDERAAALASSVTTPCAPAGDLWAAGSFAGELVTGDLENLGAEGPSDAFLTRIDVDGTTALAIDVGGPNEQQALAVAPLADGALVAGSFLGTATAHDPTSGEVVATIEGRARDGFVARVGCDGSLVWAVPMGGVLDDAVTALALAGDGVVVGGFFEHEIVLGDVVHAAPGYRAALVAKLRP